MINVKYLTEIDELSRSGCKTKCLIGEVKLIDYIKNLPNDFQDYDIQRDIVSNEYLDRLIDTVINEKHIPNITLVCNEHIEFDKIESFSVEKFKILDGLQRSYRLKIIYDTYMLLLEKIDEGYDFESSSFIKISKDLKEDLKKIGSSFKLLQSLLECYINRYEKDVKLFDSHFMQQKQWLEIWYGLSINDEIEKMLMLNAGHKSVTNEHQIELIIIRAIPELQNIKKEDIKILREKNINIAKFSKVRQKGEYHLSNIITSILAYSYGKPIKLDRKLISDIQDINNENINKEINLQFMNIDFIDKMVEFLYKLDEVLEGQYGERGIRWISRKTALVSIFGALGCYKYTMNIDDIFDKFIILTRDEYIIDIDDFESERNKINLSKVNIGEITKNRIYTSLLNRLSKYWGDGYSSYYGRL